MESPCRARILPPAAVACPSFVNRARLSHTNMSPLRQNSLGPPDASARHGPLIHKPSGAGVQAAASLLECEAFAATPGLEAP